MLNIGLCCRAGRLLLPTWEGWDGPEPGCASSFKLAPGFSHSRLTPGPSASSCLSSSSISLCLALPHCMNLNQGRRKFGFPKPHWAQHPSLFLVPPGYKSPYPHRAEIRMKRDKVQSLLFQSGLRPQNSFHTMNPPSQAHQGWEKCCPRTREVATKPKLFNQTCLGCAYGVSSLTPCHNQRLFPPFLDYCTAAAAMAEEPCSTVQGCQGHGGMKQEGAKCHIPAFIHYYL